MSGYLNNKYNSRDYNKYHENETSPKMCQISSAKNIYNYLSQTKSTTSKMKPKIFYIKNNFIDFMKKNSYKILLRKKNLKESLHDEKSNDNYHEIENYTTSPKNARLVLPPIKDKNSFNKMHLLPKIKLNRVNSNKNQNIFNVLKQKK